MKTVLYILFGAAFTFTSSLAMGLLLFRWLRIRLRAGEHSLLAFVAGSALLSEVIFLLCSTGLVRKGVFLAVGGVAIAAALRFRASDPLAKEPPLPLVWRVVFLSAFAIFGTYYFVNALAPEISPDGTAYHLAFIPAYYKAHGFVRIPWNMYANLSQGIELLFLFAFAFGKQSAAALVHFSFLAAVPWLILAYGRRVGAVLPAIAGGLFFFCSPVVGMDGSVAYVDVALAAILFALFYLLQIWDAEPSVNLLIPIGILTGFSFATKYTALVAVPYVLGFLVWKLGGRRAWKPLAIVAATALLFIVPWLVKNWLWVDNPVSPFANAIFPNPFVHISFEEDYRRFQRIYTLTSYRQLPWEVAVSGFQLTGLVGPLFLLTPLALLALRTRVGRQILLAGAVFALPYATNVGARFLIPCAPFLSIALAQAIFSIGRSQLVLLAFVLAHGVASWPSILQRYCSEYAWRLEYFPIRAALRLESEDAFMTRRFPGYSIDRMLDRTVPAGNEVFSFNQISEAYTVTKVRVKYLSAPNEVLGDILWNPIFPDFQARIHVDYTFAPRRVRKLRMVKTIDMGDALWNIAELRVYSNKAELPRSEQWRVTAQPNQWDAPLAFDNTPVTRWRSWQAGKPGMYVEVDFGAPQSVDAVRVECETDWRDPGMRVDVMDESGRWATATAAGVRTLHPVRAALRRAATQEMKARGIRYLLVGADDIGADDFHQFESFWGIRVVGDAGNAKLYYIE